METVVRITTSTSFVMMIVILIVAIALRANTLAIRFAMDAMKSITAICTQGIIVMIPILLTTVLTKIAVGAAMSIVNI
jgi:hypothetical protein